MSDAVAEVRFADGDVLVAYYFGTVDRVVPLLFPAEVADQLLDDGMDPLIEQLESYPSEEPDDVEPVTVSVPFLDLEWESSASKTASVLWGATSPDGT